jgi:hypothetical protein
MTPCMCLKDDCNDIYKVKNIKFVNSKKFVFKNELEQNI